jgi:hypothetical protein
LVIYYPLLEENLFSGLYLYQKWDIIPFFLSKP